MRLALAPRGLGALALGSGSGLALAPARLLAGSGELVGRGGGDGAVLGGRAAPPAGVVVGGGDGLGLAAGGTLVRGARLPRGQDGGHVNPRQVWLRAVSCFVLRQGPQFLSRIVPPAGVLMRPAVARRICRSWAGIRIRGRWSASLRLTDVAPRSPVIGAEARALGENGGRRGGVRARPAEPTLLEKEDGGQLEPRTR